MVGIQFKKCVWKDNNGGNQNPRVGPEQHQNSAPTDSTHVPLEFEKVQKRSKNFCYPVRTMNLLPLSVPTFKKILPAFTERKKALPTPQQETQVLARTDRPSTPSFATPLGGHANIWPCPSVIFTIYFLHKTHHFNTRERDYRIKNSNYCGSITITSRTKTIFTKQTNNAH